MLTGVLAEHMEYEIQVIQDHPFAFRAAGEPVRLSSSFLQHDLLAAVDESANMSVVVAITDDIKIRDGREIADIQNNRIFPFFVIQG